MAPIGSARGKASVEFIILSVVAGLFFASYTFWKKGRGHEDDRAKPRPRELPPADRTIQTLQIGDVASYLDVDYLVEGMLTLDEDGRVTRLYRMTDGSKVRWLAARPDDDGAVLLDEAPELVMDAAGADTLTYQGTPYRLTARGHAHVIRAGTLGSGRSGDRTRIYEYAGPGNERVIGLAWVGGDRMDVFRGERLSPGVLDLLPGQ
jgi:hypothetical protein